MVYWFMCWFQSFSHCSITRYISLNGWLLMVQWWIEFCTSRQNRYMRCAASCQLCTCDLFSCRALEATEDHIWTVLCFPNMSVHAWKHVHCVCVCHFGFKLPLDPLVNFVLPPPFPWTPPIWDFSFMMLGSWMGLWSNYPPPTLFFSLDSADGLLIHMLVPKLFTLAPSHIIYHWMGDCWWSSDELNFAPVDKTDICGVLPAVNCVHVIFLAIGHLKQRKDRIWTVLCFPNMSVHAWKHVHCVCVSFWLQVAPRPAGQFRSPTTFSMNTSNLGFFVYDAWELDGIVVKLPPTNSILLFRLRWWSIDSYVGSQTFHTCSITHYISLNGWLLMVQWWIEFCTSRQNRYMRCVASCQLWTCDLFSYWALTRQQFQSSLE